MPPKRVPPNLDDLIQRYIAGESVKKLADENGISRPALTRRLREAGVELRGRSDAERAKWATGANAERQLGAAWKARRGQRDKPSVRAARARTRQERQLAIGRYEDTLTRLLHRHQLSASQQHAAGPYNIDIAVSEPRIAMEIMTSRVNLTRAVELRKRSEYLLDHGWTVIVLKLDSGRIDLRALAQHIGALAHALRGNEALGRTYQVVRGDCESMPALRGDLADRPVIGKAQSTAE
jgi:very-short-patch-repair endonuclease